MERSAWNSTRWLWLLLAISLIAWRVSSRTAQYHPTIAGPAHQAQVAFFDANERNTAAIEASRADSRVSDLLADRLFPLARLNPPASPAYERQREARTELPPIYVDSVSLFSNPPPASPL
jgi:hypothetical protein